MKVKFFKKDNSLTDKATSLLNSPHQENLEYLSRHPALQQSLQGELDKHIDVFLQAVAQHRNRAYMNSGYVAVKVCKNLELPDDKLHHGLVGSLLLEELERRDPTASNLPLDLTIIASKGEDQTWFDYFPERKRR